jgi:hypothetical protein
VLLPRAARRDLLQASLWVGQRVVRDCAQDGMDFKHCFVFGNIPSAKAANPQGFA